VHRRALAVFDEELVVVVDTLLGEGEHAARLHWLSGPFPYAKDEEGARLTLRTPAGAYAIAVFDAEAQLVSGSAVSGQDDPPRGWQSRYYGDKVAAPSLAVEGRFALPLQWITVLGPGDVTLARRSETWSAACKGRRAAFAIREGLIERTEKTT